MQCEFYRAQRSALLEWCTQAANLQMYQEAVAAEREQLADIALLKHLAALSGQAQQLQMNGFPAELEAEQKPILDALFTDMVALGTYLQWPSMPAQADGIGTLPLDVQERGLLGCDESFNTAMLFIIDEDRIALCRNREADQSARHPHDKSY